MYYKEERWEQRYAVPKDGKWEEKTAYPRSKEQMEKNMEKCKELGYRYISCKKLYPFSTMKNQHNFDLIHNIAMNEMYDMESGEKPWDDAEYERLEKLRDKSGEFFCLPLPVAWLPWEEWKAAKEMAENAIFHRQEACIAAGRPDLVTYC